MQPQAKLQATKTRKAVLVGGAISAVFSALVAIAVGANIPSSTQPWVMVGVVAVSLLFAVVLLVVANAAKSSLSLDGTQLTYSVGKFLPQVRVIDLSRIVDMNAIVWHGNGAKRYEMPKHENSWALVGETTLGLTDDTKHSIGINLKGYDKAEIRPLLRLLSDIAHKPTVTTNTIVLPALERWGLVSNPRQTGSVDPPAGPPPLKPPIL